MLPSRRGIRCKRPSAPAAVAILLGLVLLQACSPAPTDDASCGEIEAKEFPGLRSVASEALGNLEDSSQRLSGCSDMGVPEAALVVQVDSSRTRADVADHLEAGGWRVEGGGSTAYSPDDRFTAELRRIGQSSGSMHVEVVLRTRA